MLSGFLAGLGLALPLVRIRGRFPDDFEIIERRMAAAPTLRAGKKRKLMSLKGEKILVCFRSANHLVGNRNVVAPASDRAIAMQGGLVACLYAQL